MEPLVDAPAGLLHLGEGGVEGATRCQLDLLRERHALHHAQHVLALDVQNHKVVLPRENQLRVRHRHCPVVGAHLHGGPDGSAVDNGEVAWLAAADTHPCPKALSSGGACHAARSGLGAHARTSRGVRDRPPCKQANWIE